MYPCIFSKSDFFLNQYLNIFFGTVCHQDTAKTFICKQSALLVCARCTGIYLSIAIVSLFILLTQIRIRINTKFLIYLSLPMLGDVIFYSIGFYNYSKITAAITGILFGSSVFLYILEALENYIYITKK